jgi:hypothetical protein
MALAPTQALRVPPDTLAGDDRKRDADCGAATEGDGGDGRARRPAGQQHDAGRPRDGTGEVQPPPGR